MNRQTQNASFNPSINLVEGGNWLLAVTSFEATNSLFNITNENNLFPISIPRHWSSRGGAETIHKLQPSLKLRSEKILNYMWKKFKKKGAQIEIGNNENELSDLGTRKNETIEELKDEEYNDLEDMVLRMEITYSEIEKILDVKCVNGSTVGYTLPSGVHEISDIDLMLKSLLPDELKINITLDDIRLKSNLSTNKTITFTKRSFLFTILGFTQSYSRPLDVEGFAQLIPGSYKSDKRVNIFGIDKIH